MNKLTGKLSRKYIQIGESNVLSKATGLPLSTAFAASSKSLKQDCELFSYNNPID